MRRRRRILKLGHKGGDGHGGDGQGGVGHRGVGSSGHHGKPQDQVNQSKDAIVAAASVPKPSISIPTGVVGANSVSSSGENSASSSQSSGGGGGGVGGGSGSGNGGSNVSNSGNGGGGGSQSPSNNPTPPAASDTASAAGSPATAAGSSYENMPTTFASGESVPPIVQPTLSPGSTSLTIPLSPTSTSTGVEPQGAATRNHLSSAATSGIVLSALLAAAAVFIFFFWRRSKPRRERASQWLSVNEGDDDYIIRTYDLPSQNTTSTGNRGTDANLSSDKGTSLSHHASHGHEASRDPDTELASEKRTTNSHLASHGHESVIYMTAAPFDLEPFKPLPTLPEFPNSTLVDPFAISIPPAARLPDDSTHRNSTGSVRNDSRPVSSASSSEISDDGESLEEMSLRLFSSAEPFTFPKPPISTPSPELPPKAFSPGSAPSSNRVSLNTQGSTTSPTTPSPLHNLFVDPFIAPQEIANCMPQLGSVETIYRPFLPTLDDELFVVPGDIVRIVRSFNDGWALVEHESGIWQGSKGHIPVDCLQQSGQNLPAFLATKRVGSYYSPLESAPPQTPITPLTRSHSLARKLA